MMIKSNRISSYYDKINYFITRTFVRLNYSEYEFD